MLSGALFFMRGALGASTGVVFNCTLSQLLDPPIVDSSSHDTRSILNIIWSCITTIIASCWIAVHPNILDAKAGFWRSVTHRLNHMTWMILAPELMICWAIRQWLGARNLMKKRPFNEAQSGWTITHGYFIQMGGFVLEGEGPDILSAERLTSLVKEGKVEFPKITAGEIQDRSKCDGFSKTIAVGQTAWFLAQCIARKVQGLVVTELELVTTAIAGVNVFVYYFWWNKPMDIRTTVTVPLLKVNVVQDEKQDNVESFQLKSSDNSNLRAPVKLAKPERLKVLNQRQSHLQSILRRIHTFIEISWVPIEIIFAKVSGILSNSPAIKPGTTQIFAFYALDTTEQEKAIIWLCVGAIGGFFGAIHCAGWYYFFPSHPEPILWRASSVCISSIPILAGMGTYLRYASKHLEARCIMLSSFLGTIGKFSLWIAMVGMVPYIFARIILLVEAFISLRNLPSEALFAVSWDSFFPHF